MTIGCVLEVCGMVYKGTKGVLFKFDVEDVLGWVTGAILDSKEEIAKEIKVWLIGEAMEEREREADSRLSKWKQVGLYKVW